MHNLWWILDYDVDELQPTLENTAILLANTFARCCGIHFNLPYGDARYSCVRIYDYRAVIASARSENHWKICSLRNYAFIVHTIWLRDAFAKSRQQSAGIHRRGLRAVAISAHSRRVTLSVAYCGQRVPIPRWQKLSSNKLSQSRPRVARRVTIHHQQHSFPCCPLCVGSKWSGHTSSPVNANDSGKKNV